MANIGFGAKLKTSTDNTSGTLAFLDEPVTIEFPSVEGSAVETTTLTVANRLRSYIPGLLTPATFNFTLRYNKPDYTKLLGNINTVQLFEIDGAVDASSYTTTITFSGILLKADINYEADQVVNIKAEVKITTAVTTA